MSARASFVIPVHNGQKYLSDALRSCLNQSVRQLEVVVVNDASTDGTQELIDWMAGEDRRILPIHLKSHVGRSEARNIGNSKASADYVFVLDADDIACKNRVKDSLVVFQLKKVDLVYGPFYDMDELNNVLGPVKATLFNPELAKEKKMNFICHSTMAYRRDVAKEIHYLGGEWSRLGLDDWKFQWDAHLKGFKYGVTKSPLSYYRHCTEGTISTQRDPKEVLTAKEEFLNAI